MPQLDDLHRFYNRSNFLQAESITEFVLKTGEQLLRVPVAIERKRLEEKLISAIATGY